MAAVVQLVRSDADASATLTRSCSNSRDRTESGRR
jgi:hypothetical protein